MKRIDDLDVAGRVVLLRADLNVPLDGEVITDDRRIRASLPTLTALTGRGARVIVCAHLGRPKGGELRRPRGRRPVAAAGGGPAVGAARPAGRVRRGRGRRVGRAPPRPGWPTATSRCSRTCGSSPPRPARTTRSGRCWRPGWPSSPTPTSATGSVPCTASTPASTTCPGCSRTRPGSWCWPRSPCCASSPPTRPRPYVVVLGGAKPSDKLAVIGNLARPRRPAAHRRRHGLHVPGGPGPPGRGLAAGGRSDPARCPPCWPRRPARGGGGAAGGPRGGRPVRPRTPSPRSCPAADIPAGRMGWTSGPATRELFAAQAGRREDRVLERAARGVRVPRVRRRHPGGRRGDQRRDRPDRGGRRRLRGGRPAAGLPRRCVHPHLHRGRGEPGVPGGRGAARADRAGGAREPAGGASAAAGCRSWPATGR